MVPVYQASEGSLITIKLKQINVWKINMIPALAAAMIAAVA